MVKIGFIGMGSMGDAILNGLLRTHGPEEMILSAVHQDRIEVVTVRIKMPHACPNRECAEAAKYLMLAIKPQYFDAVLSKIRDAVISEQVVVSLTPGIIISNIAERLRGSMRAVRAMPSTSAMLGEGITGVPYEEASYTEEEKETVQDILPSCGRTRLVEERLMDTVGYVGGSSPAFAYVLIEALADSGVKYGLPRKTAYAMTVQTVLGSAKTILETGKHPGQLKDEVYSPGGTAITGVSALEGHGPRSVVIKAADACYEETQRMKQNNDVKP